MAASGTAGLLEGAHFGGSWDRGRFLEALSLAASGTARVPLIFVGRFLCFLAASRTANFLLRLKGGLRPRASPEGCPEAASGTAGPLLKSFGDLGLVVCWVSSYHFHSSLCWSVSHPVWRAEPAWKAPLWIPRLSSLRR